MEMHHEMARQIQGEFDFHREADMQTIIGANIKNAFPAERITVPRVFARYTSNKLMVMEYVKGAKIVPFLKTNRAAAANVVKTILEAYGQMVPALLLVLLFVSFIHIDADPPNDVGYPSL
jgi:predicted unusual protein kinase regulating ubiquinone biosynthesis (AarF/ABC1/UbiB family)